MDHEKWLEQHDRMIADHDRFIAEHREWLQEHRKAIAEHERSLAAHERTMNQIDAMLRHAVRLSIREARNERRKRRELDDKITQLAAAQLVTEENLQGLIASLRRGGNGQ